MYTQKSLYAYCLIENLFVALEWETVNLMQCKKILGK